MKIKVIQNDTEQIIDNVISCEQFMGDKTAMTDHCGSFWTHSICPECREKNNLEGCGKIFIVGYIKGAPQELFIETSEKTHIFLGDDIEVEILDYGETQGKTENIRMEKR